MARAPFFYYGLPLVGLALSMTGCHASSDAGAAGDGAASPEAPKVSASASASAPASRPASSSTASASSSAPDAVVTTTVLREGTGATAKDGDRVKVHYTASILDGPQFASSREKNQPLTFTIGERSITRGMSQGVTGMKIGEKRRLVVPPALAYGERSNAKIPPNSTLVYEVELLAIEGK